MVGDMPGGSRKLQESIRGRVGYYSLAKMRSFPLMPASSCDGYAGSKDKGCEPRLARHTEMWGLHVVVRSIGGQIVQTCAERSAMTICAKLGMRL